MNLLDGLVQESTSSNITLTIRSNITISANFEIDCSYWQNRYS